MNQNNNIIGYDSQTGKPIYANQNVNIQQSQNNTMFEQQSIQQVVQQPQNNTTIEQQSMQQVSKKNNKIIIIVVILIIVGIVAIILYFSVKKNMAVTNKDSSNNSGIENNINSNDIQQENNNIGDEKYEVINIGVVEDGTNTTYDENGAFLCAIEDVFTITGRGTVVTGTVQRGKVEIGDTVQIVGLSNEILTTTVIGVEMFMETKTVATVGDNVGLVLKDIKRDQVQIGQVLAKTDSIVASTKFDADVHILSKEEGGRHTPFFDGYSPQFYFRTTDVKGIIKLPDNIESVNPGENLLFTTTLISPIAMEVGTEFSIKDGGRTIGTGTVTKIY